MYEEEPSIFANKWVLLGLLSLGIVIIGMATYMYQRSQNEGVLYTCTVAHASDRNFHGQTLFALPNMVIFAPFHAQ